MQFHFDWLFGPAANDRTDRATAADDAPVLSQDGQGLPALCPDLAHELELGGRRLG